MQRRLFLKNILIASTVTIGTLLSPITFAEWKEEGFNADSFEAAIAAIGADKAEDSDKITIKVPEMAENGHIVPIDVSTKLEDVSEMHLLIKENVSPLSASFSFAKLAIPSISSRFKVAKKSDIVVIVKAGDKMYKATANVNVTIGGCGG